MEASMDGHECMEYIIIIVVVVVILLPQPANFQEVIFQSPVILYV